MQDNPTQMSRPGLLLLFLLALLPSCVASPDIQETMINPPVSMMGERQVPECDPGTNNDLLVCMTKMSETINRHNADKRGLSEWAKSLEVVADE